MSHVSGDRGRERSAILGHRPATFWGESSVLAVFGSADAIDQYANAADRIRGLMPLLGF
jgi:hypothetical protein